MTDVEAIIELELPKLLGWCTVEKAKRMAELARGAHLCVELGVFGGRGLVAMALALKDQGFGSAHGVDPFTATASREGTNDPANAEWWARVDYDAVYRAADRALQRLDLFEHARIIIRHSCEPGVVDVYPNEGIDVLHQDANHSEETSCKEVKLWAPKIRAGGYWIFDDTDWASTQKAQRELEALGFKEIENHESWKVYRKP